jgi:hypothetical protein
VKRHLEALKKRLMRRFPDIRGIWFLEFQRRGAPHFHLLISIDLSLHGELIQMRRTGKFRGQKSKFFFTVPRLQDLVSDLWYRIVVSGDLAHKKAGCCWEVLESEEAAQRYAAMHAAKPKQKEVPPDFRNVGRFWGKIGDVKLVKIGVVPATTADVLFAFGPNALSAGKSRVKKSLYGAQTREEI